MKDSDLKKEKLKKAALFSGIGVAGAAAASGIAYAATRPNDDTEILETEEPIVEVDEATDYIEAEEQGQEEFFESPQPVYVNTPSSSVSQASTVSVASAANVAESQASVANTPSVPIPDAVTDIEMSEIIPVNDAVIDDNELDLMAAFQPVSPSSDILLANDELVTTSVTEDLTDIYYGEDDLETPQAIAIDVDLADCADPFNIGLDHDAGVEPDFSTDDNIF